MRGLKTGKWFTMQLDPSPCNYNDSICAMSMPVVLHWVSLNTRGILFNMPHCHSINMNLWSWSRFLILSQPLPSSNGAGGGNLSPKMKSHRSERSSSLSAGTDWRKHRINAPSPVRILPSSTGKKCSLDEFRYFADGKLAKFKFCW